MTVKRIFFLGLFGFFVHGFAFTAYSLDTADIVKLKKAGVSDQVIKTVMDEKVIETCAFSVDEIIELKKAGMSSETIDSIIKKGSFTKNNQPVVYGTETKSLRSPTPGDLIELKKAGISDEVLNSIVMGSYDYNNPEHRRAWNMLENMGLIVDGGGWRR